MTDPNVNKGFLRSWFSSFWEMVPGNGSADPVGTPLELRTVFLLLGAWVLTMLGLGTLSNYNDMIPGAKFLMKLPTGWILLVGFIAMVWMWGKIAPVPEDRWDISPRTARLWFWPIVALALYLRLFDRTIPSGDWWDDHFIHTSDIRNTLDTGWHPIFFPSGSRESFFPYLTALLWSFRNETTGVVIMQFSNTLIDLLTMFVFYLLGKEIAGRRMGILFLGMGAFCKIMIEVTKNQMGCDSCVLGGALAFLFLIRLVKKPDFIHFVQWGLAVGFGGYTYVPLRPWLPVMLGGVFLWAWSTRADKRIDIYRLVIGPGLLLAWAFLFVYKNGFLTKPSLVAFLSDPKILWGTVGVLSVCYLKVFWEEWNRGFSRPFMWATAAVVVALVMTPAYLYPFYGAHVSAIAVFSDQMASSASAAWIQFVGNLKSLMPMFFGNVGAPVSLPWLGDSMYDFFVAACGLLGLAYFFARPRWIPAMAILFLFISFIPGIMSNGPHTQRYVAANTPLLLMSALGLSRLWLAFLQARYTRMMNLAFAVCVLAFTAWHLHQTRAIYKLWMSHRCQDALIYDQVLQEYPAHRVYLKPYNNDQFYNTGMDILADAKTIYVMNDSNLVDLRPEDTGKDLVVMINGKDTRVQKALAKEFPDVQWQKQFMFIQPTNDVPFLWWTEIPFDRLKKARGSVFRVRRVPKSKWTRRYYGKYGVGRGLIRYEDTAWHWNDALGSPAAAEIYCSARMEGDLNIKTAGEHTFTIQTGNILWFYLDGKKVLAHDRHEMGKKKSFTVLLNPGVHHVEVVNGFFADTKVSPILVSAPGSSAEVPLDEFAMSTAPDAPQPMAENSANTVQAKP